MFIKRRYSIKNEVLYLGLFFSIISILIIGALFSISLFNLSVESAKSSLKDTNMKISLYTEGHFSEITNTVKALANNPNIKNAINDEQSRESALMIYNEFSNANENISYIYSGYENGLLLINDYTPPTGYDPTNRPWYTAAMDKKPDISIGLPYQDAVNGEWLISQSRALKDFQGNYHGVIAIDLSLETIVTLINERHLYDSQHTYILDQDGKIIVHADPSFIGQSSSVIREIITEKEGELTYTLDNKKYWGHYHTYDATGWIYITVVDRWEILQPMIAQIIFYTLGSMLIAFILGILQSKIFGRRFAEPLINLGRRVAAITEGKPSRANTYSHSNYEIAVIAENIEQLAEHSLNKKANELKTIIESIEEGVLVVNNDRQIIYTNTRFRKMWHISKNIIISSTDDRSLTNAILDQLLEPEKFLENLQALYNSNQDDIDMLYLKDGRVFERFSRAIIEENNVIGRIWSFRDITDRKKAEDKLRILATTDELTGIWNRRYFMQAVEQEIQRTKRYHQEFSILLLDIDHFKKINDTLGHAAGDFTLQHLVSIFKKCLRQTDIMGRLGGEEFGILLPETDLGNAVKLAERLRHVIEVSPANYNGRDIYITVSIGITTYQQGISSVDELLKTADDALYEAKSNGRNRIFDNSMDIKNVAQ